ncbi:MAG TPA: hypothetical protein VMW52_12525 [Phycisphaerae bacterium]|nr:hypothetical protein [Phycisphaerae bacterium]
MGIALNDTEQQALRRDTSIFEAASEQHIDQILADLQSQIDGQPIEGSVNHAAMADDAVDVEELADALADRFVKPTWGTPGAEAGNEIEVDLQLVDAKGENLAEELVLEIHVADTEYGADSGTATIAAGAGAEGTIISGSGTAAIKAQTDATGLLALKVAEAAAASRFLSSRPCHGSPMLDCRNTCELTFT